MDRIRVRLRRYADREAIQLQWVCPVSGRRKTQSAGTSNEAEAEQRRADLEYQLNNGLHAEPSRISWESFREAFEEEYLPARAPLTQAKYRHVLDLFERLASPTTLRGVNTRVVSRFVAALRQLPEPRGKLTGYKPSTIAVTVEFLRAALLWAVEQKLLVEAPVFPAVPVPKKRPQPVPTELFERLVQRLACPQLRAFVLCGWLAGLRRNEAYRLSWEATEAAPWVDLARERIVFPAESVKGREDQWVPLDRALRAALLALPRHEGGRVFRFVANDGHELKPEAVVRRIVTEARNAGVILTMRTLRRGFGCRYAAKTSAHVLQRLLRHRSINTTLSFYAAFDATIEAAVLGSNTRDNTPSETTSKREE